MSIIIYDCETTGLLKPIGNDIIHQPHMTELYCLRVNDEYEFEDEFYSLIKPGAPIPDFLEKAIGITNDMVRTAPRFEELYEPIFKVFQGCHTQVAHNLTFDKGVLGYELERIGKLEEWKWPEVDFCTVEQSIHIKGHRLKNGELYEIATGKQIEGAHKAKNDVMATFESFKWLRSQDGRNI